MTRVISPTAKLVRGLRAESTAAMEQGQRILTSPFVHVRDRPVLILGNHMGGTSAIAGLVGARRAELRALSESHAPACERFAGKRAEALDLASV
jgi:hypothetical protein